MRVIEAVQRTRRGPRGRGRPGQRLRGQQNLASEIAPDAAVAVNTGFRPAVAAEINERLTESLMSIYSYDQAGVSLVLSGDLDGMLRVYIESATGLAEILIPPEEWPGLAQAIQQQEEVDGSVKYDLIINGTIVIPDQTYRDGGTDVVERSSWATSSGA